MNGSAPAPVHWRILRVRPTDEASRQALVAALIAAGAGGVQEQGDALVTHLPTTTDLSAVHAAVLRHAGTTIETEELGPVDWSAAWPTQVGIQRLGRLTIAPPWLADEAAAPAGGALVLIEPGMAFGTGEHATTRGVVRLMQRVIQSGDAVADLGSGSAVLAIGAAKLGASRVFAIEMDEEAIANAEENVARNAVADRVVVIHGDATQLLPIVAPVRVILANIISSVLVELAPAMRKALAPDGVAIVSGVLTSERDGLIATLAAGGWRCLDEDVEGEWWSGIIAPA